MSRSVLVSGGNRGIGLAIAQRFAACGDGVTVTSRSGEEIEGLTVARCDVRDAAAVDAAFTIAEAAHGPVTAAIANAVFDALGLRVRNLPITRDSLIAAMELSA